MAEKLKPGAIFVTFTKGLLTNGSYVRASWIVRLYFSLFFSIFQFFFLILFSVGQNFFKIDNIGILPLQLFYSTQISLNTDFLLVVISHY